MGTTSGRSSRRVQSLGPPVPFSFPDSRDLLEVLVEILENPLSTFTK